MWWPSVNLEGAEVVMHTDGGSILYRLPDGTHTAADDKGRPVVPAADRERFWVMTTTDQVAYMFDKLAKVECSGEWMAERLSYLGLIPSADLMMPVKTILQGVGWGHSVEEAKGELRALGVKV